MKNQTILAEIINRRKKREMEKQMRRPDGQIFKIKFKAVYQYRNRWVLGTIEGKLDTFARKFTQTGKKKGIQSIKNANDAFGVISITKHFVTLRSFLARKIVSHNKNSHNKNMYAFSEPVQKEAKYLERLVLKGAKVNRMWVDYNSIII